MHVVTVGGSQELLTLLQMLGLRVNIFKTVLVGLDQPKRTENEIIWQFKVFFGMLAILKLQRTILAMCSLHFPHF